MSTGHLWTLEKAAKFCRLLETVAPAAGAHVALTGGALYRDGERKDVDILVYRIRQVEHIDWPALWRSWRDVAGVHLVQNYGWCKKAVLPDGSQVDFFDPEDDSKYADYEPVVA